MGLKLTYPVARKEPANKKLFNMMELVWHTFIPVVLTYFIVKYSLVLLLLPLLATFFVRIHEGRD